VPMEARRAPPLRPCDHPIKLMSHHSARRYALSRLVTHAHDLVSTTIYCEPGLNDDEHVLAVPGADRGLRRDRHPRERSAWTSDTTLSGSCVPTTRKRAWMVGIARGNVRPPSPRMVGADCKVAAGRRAEARRGPQSDRGRECSNGMNVTADTFREGQTDKQTNRQTDKQTDKQIFG
jgi:hypothetical protein